MNSFVLLLEPTIRRDVTCTQSGSAGPNVTQTSIAENTLATARDALVLEVILTLTPINKLAVISGICHHELFLSAVVCSWC